MPITMKFIQVCSFDIEKNHFNTFLPILQNISKQIITKKI